MTRLLLLLVLFAPARAQRVRVVTADVDRFWSAFDSAVAEPDSAARVAFVQTRHLDAGTSRAAATGAPLPPTLIDIATWAE